MNGSRKSTFNDIYTTKQLADLLFQPPLTGCNHIMVTVVDPKR
ncbi:hypothetical protein HanXRQr2_Chr15g0699381 [Helianthus annuus]|uniref:Uncharacterized protein n=1 Tax=Helianthus annuus TaxID=4232 RepID=A0A9K3E2Y1_HELAN|nr:hypothetical protein HanXRQr2_Chr15g0699381 [Helianthus annuus]KAJ0831781.1 hypothetical protein HanPSC8_Chr15g0671071 [Helianthus annuus]